MSEVWLGGRQRALTIDTFDEALHELVETMGRATSVRTSRLAVQLHLEARPGCTRAPRGGWRKVPRGRSALPATASHGLACRREMHCVLGMIQSMFIWSMRYNAEERLISARTSLCWLSRNNREPICVVGGSRGDASIYEHSRVPRQKRG